MISRHFALLASIALTGFVGVGCQQKQAASSQSSSIPAVAAKPTTQPAMSRSQSDDRPQITDASGNADVVAQRANMYAKQMESLLAQRGSTTEQQSPTTRPTERETHTPANDVTTSAQHSPTLSNSGFAVNQGNAVLAAPSSITQPKTVSPPAVVETPPAKAPVVKQAPANTPAAPTTDELAQRLAQHVKDYPQDLSAQFDYELYEFLHGESVPDMQKLAGLGTEDRELLAALMDGLSNFRTAARSDNNMLLSRKVRPILEAADRIRTQAELSIPTVALCSRVTTYGNYEPFDPARFAAGVEHEVAVYCEVENFSSQLDSQHLWETSLREEIVLYSDQGQQVWTADRVTPRPTIDRSRTRRHDFFLGRLIRLPANLSIGRYILKVSVVDQQVNRVAENSAPLEIVAQ